VSKFYRKNPQNLTANVFTYEKYAQKNKPAKHFVMPVTAWLK